MKRTCPNCEKDLKPHHKTVCSHACRAAIRRTSLTLACAVCGNQFTAQPGEIKRGRGKYCSPECYAIGLEQPKDTLFWKRVEKSEGCWLWTGPLKNGYGRFDTSREFKMYAHRFSYELHHGVTLSTAQHLLHSCDTPRCVNPAHLSIGTHADNMRDCAEKKRTCSGEARPQSKLTDEIVRAIRKEFAEHKVTYKVLGERYGVCEQNIGQIVRRQTWKHLSD